MNFRSSLALLAVLGLAVTGCSSADAPERDPLALRSSTLTRAQSCADLERRLKTDAVVKMNAQIDAMEAMAVEYGFGRGGDEEAMPSAGDDGASGTGDFADGNGEPEPPDHSETNTQVEGVDEADIVKTDGNYIYLLHGQSFQVLSAWPASDLAITGSLAIEGQPLEMFVAGDRVVVYSTIDGAKLYEEAGLAAPSVLQEMGYYGGGAMMDEGYWGPALPFTKMTVLEMSGDQPTLVKELYFEGTYASARRVDNQVRTVLTAQQHGPVIDYFPGGDIDDEDDLIEGLEFVRYQNLMRIAGSKLEEWLPKRLERSGGALTSLPPSCEDYWVPTEASTQYGLTQIQAVDLDALSAPREVSIVGAATTVYEGEDSMYLAAPAWVDPYWGFSVPAVPTSTSATHLHKFDIASDPKQPAYVASGTVPGMIHNQFSLDEKDGYLRVATTDTLVSDQAWDQVNGVYVVTAEGNRLATAGKVTGIAPGESIYSTRFLGERGYVVTFRQVDPLFVLDLADPKNPKLVSELTIPGFSEYMHPLDEGHLLTVGRDGTEDGQILGLALQIIDVTDAAAPKVIHKHVLSGDAWSGSSEAEQNHKALTFFEGLLAIPYTDYNSAVTSTLEVFKVDAANGIAPQGSIDHSKFFSEMGEAYGYCGGYYGVGVRRGVFIENVVYSISYGGLLAHSIDDLTTPLASVALPAPTSYYECYGY